MPVLPADCHRHADRACELLLRLANVSRPQTVIGEMPIQPSKTATLARPLILALFAGAGLVLAYQLANTLLLIFAGILLAVVLDVATEGLGKVLPIHRLARLGIVSVIGVLMLMTAIAWGGMRMVSEARSLAEIATQQLGEFNGWLHELGLVGGNEEGGDAEKNEEGEEGQARQGRSTSSLLSLLPAPEKLFGHAQSTLKLATGLLSNAVIIGFLALFFAAAPIDYREGFLKLLPVAKRPRVREVLVETGHTLRWWLVGQLATMALVAISIGLMLFLVGIPNAVLLGLLAGALNFIPFLGPILAAVPVLLAALPEGAAMVMLVMGLFVVIQSVEGYLVSPLIQKKAVYLPPAWSLAALVGFGVLFGGMGVALATPLLAVARIMTLRLYVEDVLERPRGEPG